MSFAELRGKTQQAIQQTEEAQQLAKSVTETALYEANALLETIVEGLTKYSNRAKEAFEEANATFASVTDHELIQAAMASNNRAVEHLDSVLETVEQIREETAGYLQATNESAESAVDSGSAAIDHAQTYLSGLPG